MEQTNMFCIGGRTRFIFKLSAFALAFLLLLSPITPVLAEESVAGSSPAGTDAATAAPNGNTAPSVSANTTAPNNPTAPNTTLNLSSNTTLSVAANDTAKTNTTPQIPTDPRAKEVLLPNTSASAAKASFLAATAGAAIAKNKNGADTLHITPRLAAGTL